MILATVKEKLEPSFLKESSTEKTPIKSEETLSIGQKDLLRKATEAFNSVWKEMLEWMHDENHSITTVDQKTLQEAAEYAFDKIASQSGIDVLQKTDLEGIGQRSGGHTSERCFSGVIQAVMKRNGIKQTKEFWEHKYKKFLP